jgi:hypothetical protein
MEQMQTMTKSYGIAAVGRAAAATVMLPLAVGVDLIILPGPQVRPQCSLLPVLCYTICMPVSHVMCCNTLCLKVLCCVCLVNLA